MWPFLELLQNIRIFFICIYTEIHTPIESPYRVVTLICCFGMDFPVKKFKKPFKIKIFERSGFWV